jgi:hypothetical protein
MRAVTTSPDDPRGWLHIWPDLAALAAGSVALLIRTSNSDGPRSWRVVLADAAGTIALGYALYRLAIGSLDNADIAFGLAVLGGAMGWEWVRRLFGAWAMSRVK